MKQFSLSLLALSVLTMCTCLHAMGQEKAEEAQPVRTLRVLVGGARAMPVFETRGDKIVEVDPPLSLMPPTSFAFANAGHVPKSPTGQRARSSYSAWAGELVKIENYKGPSSLPLLLKRPLVTPNGAGQQVVCDLNQSINPLLVLHPDRGSSGWKTPQVKVIDMNPLKLNSRSVLVINQSPFPLRVYFSSKAVLLNANSHGLVKLPLSKGGRYRYRIDTAVDGKVVTVSNSSYQVRKGTRLIVLAMPSPAKIKSNPISLRLISDSI